jgi:hypothetical protein
VLESAQASRGLAQRSCRASIAHPVRAALFATLLVWALWPTTVRADVPPGGSLNLEWNAGAGCPDRADAEAAIREILGSRVVTGGPADVVHVDISELGDGRWEGLVRARGPGGSSERRFVGPTCSLVVDAAVLVVALMLDPVASAERINSMREGSQRAVTPSMQGPARDRSRVLVGLRAVGDVGSLPGPAAGLGVVLGVQYGRWLLEGGATVWTPRLALAAPADDRGGEIGLYSGDLRGCWDGVRSASGELRLGGCLDGEAGATTGQGTIGLAQRHQTSGLWAAVYAGIMARQVSATGLTPWLSLDVGAPIRRPAFVIDGGSNTVFVFQASGLVGRVAIGLAWIFP